MRIKLLVVLIAWVQLCNAQDYIGESLLYSRSELSGTARSVGSANAYGSVGADLGSLSINPAGLGIYRSSDFCITGGVKITANETNYNGSYTNASSVHPYISQAGAVWTTLLKKEDDKNQVSFNPRRHLLRSFSFAFNYQRENFYARTQNFGAYNTTSSMMDNYTAYLNAKLVTVDGSAPAELQMAYAANLIQYNSAMGNYYSNVRAPVYQQGGIVTKGGTDKINFGFGGNIDDKLYFGFDIGVPILNYGLNLSYAEANPNGSDSITHFSSYSVNSELNITGVGFTGALGVIYRPVSWARFGVAYHLPTWYALTENYQTAMNINYDTSSFTYSGAYPQPFKYGFRSPMRGVASLSLYYKQYGFLSVDYEFQNFGSSHFHVANDSTDMASQINSYLKSTFTYGHVVRVGVEGSYKVLRLRAGYAYSSSPYKKNQFEAGYSEARHNITAGIGVRLTHFYADLAYVYGITKDASYPYATDPVLNTYTTHSVLLTLGWKISKENTAKRRSSYNTPPPADPDKGQYRY